MVTGEQLERAAQNLVDTQQKVSEDGYCSLVAACRHMVYIYRKACLQADPRQQSLFENY